MFRAGLMVIGIAASWAGLAQAADDWKARLNPTERTCLDRIEKTEGPISGMKTVKTTDRSGGFDLLLEVDRRGAPIHIRCQGTTRDGAAEITDVTRE